MADLLETHANIESMPELPEVETIRRLLEPLVAGRRFVEVQVRHPRTARRNEGGPPEIEDRLRGRRILDLDRRGKFLMGHLDRDLTWVVHLGMSGRMSSARVAEPEEPHTHFVGRLTGRREVRFVDPRTFGFVGVFTDTELERVLAGVGPDALIGLPDLAVWEARLAARLPPIKALLLAQRIVSGLGNIYADEVLFRARIAPYRPGGSLSHSEVVRLRRSIRPVLEAGLASGGTTLSDMAYLLPDGRAGDYLERLAVYGREGEWCRRCGTEIMRMTIAGRSSFWCPSCQQ